MAAWPESQRMRFSWSGLGAVVALHALVAGWLLHAQTYVPAKPPTVLSLSLLRPEPVAPQPVVQPPPPVPGPPRPQRLPAVPRPIVTEAAPTSAAEAAVPDTPSSAPPVQPGGAALAAPAAAPPGATPARFDVDYLDNPKPDYPPLSRRLQEEGRVVLHVLVSAHGLPTDVRLHAGCGYRRLEEAALHAVRRWRFVPARRGGEPVAAAVFVPIVFALKD